MARCAVLLRKFRDCSVICVPRRRGWRVAPVCWKITSGTLRGWRIAQLHPARRAPS
ncbi:hypothetical protein A2U01_0077947 [Trifolium medium]|uniref:Uncharacterized protein n=1 Tax=Trifolium medium TaxID=97028 RepID=A0A392T9C2_9FABA|nr:hypothetical protein [Trifolium medium]